MLRVGQDQHGPDAAFVVVAGVTQLEQDPCEVRDHRIQAGDDVQRGADVEGAHARVGGARGPGELTHLRLSLALGGGRRIAGRDCALHERLEPGPRDPAVGCLVDALVDVRRLLDPEVSRLAGDEAGVGCLHLERLDAPPQPWQAVGDVDRVGHQRLRRTGRDLHPRSEHSRRELEHLGRPLCPEPLRLLTPGQLDVLRVEAVGAVEGRVLECDAQRLRLGFPLSARHRLGVSEELGLGQAFESGGCGHESTQAPTTDIETGGQIDGRGMRVRTRSFRPDRHARRAQGVSIASSRQTRSRLAPGGAFQQHSVAVRSRGASGMRAWTENLAGGPVQPRLGNTFAVPTVMSPPRASTSTVASARLRTTHCDRTTSSSACGARWSRADRGPHA